MFDLVTDKIIVKRTKLEDIERIRIIEADNNEYIRQNNFEQHKEILEKESHLSIFERKSNLLVGFVILVGTINSNRIVEFRRIVVSKKGFGYGKDAIQLIKKVCFEHYKANKIWLDVYADNERAIKLYESMGFKKDVEEDINKSRKLLILSISNN